MRVTLKSTAKVVAIVVAALLFAGIAYTLGASGSLAPNAATVTSRDAGAGTITEQYGSAVGGAPGAAPQESLVAPEAAPLSGGGDTKNATADKSTADASVIIRTASMDIRVKAIRTAIEEVRKKTAAAKAEITDLYLDEGPGGQPVPLDKSSASDYPASATITIRVPAEGLDRLQEQLSGIGTVISESSSSNDVTEQHVDLTARLKNLQAQEAQLRAFFAKADKVTDLLAVEQELSRVRGEIEAMQAQIDYLDRQAARATLTVTLSEPGAVVSPAGPSWGVSEAVTNGLRGAMAIVNGTITMAIALAPFVVLLLIVWVIFRAIRRRRAARVHHGSADAAPTSADTEPLDGDAE